MDPVDIVTCADAPAMRAWLERHHASAPFVWIGFHRKATGVASITWPESVDEALCFGWIDGIRKSVDEARDTIRFTPRRPRSISSAVNVARVLELERLGRMTDAGRRAFAQRRDERTAVSSFEQERRELDGEYLATLQSYAKAFACWQLQPPSYRRRLSWWIVSAKRDETRRRRLATLIERLATGKPPM